ncbi:MAG: glutaredoxin 3 [Pseudomonadota bacterium]
MASVTVYTKPGCPYCSRALALLAKKGVDVDDISAAYDEEKREEMRARSNGGRTYPQIFIGDTHVGGCDDLIALERSGKLDPLLNDTN